MDSAYDWKQFYNAERERIGATAMLAMVDAAQPLDLEDGGAIVIPHTRFEITGSQIAAAVSTVLESGTERVLALGVLHGARRSDHQQVTRAKAGDTEAVNALRGVHEEDGLAAEEFSLDAFVQLLTLAAQRQGRPIDVVRSYPFLVGEDPESLPAIGQLQELVDDGALLVATTDPMHHGRAYGTPAPDCLDPLLASTREVAGDAIGEQLDALSGHRFTEFARLVERDRSDFRDTGPVMAHLLGSGFKWQICDLALVDYSVVLDSSGPSWVAGALITATSVQT